jgi:hypothetical protein
MNPTRLDELDLLVTKRANGAYSLALAQGLDVILRGREGISEGFAQQGFKDAVAEMVHDMLEEQETDNAAENVMRGG